MANKKKRTRKNPMAWRVNQFMERLMQAPEQLERSCDLIAALIHRAGGDVLLDMREGAQIREDYTLGVEKNSINPNEVRLRLYARPRNSRTADEENAGEHRTGAGS